MGSTRCSHRIGSGGRRGRASCPARWSCGGASRSTTEACARSAPGSWRSPCRRSTRPRARPRCGASPSAWGSRRSRRDSFKRPPSATAGRFQRRCCRREPRPRRDHDHSDLVRLRRRLGPRSNQDLVERSRRPVILAGRGAVLADAGPALEALGERIGALLATSLMGNGLFAGNAASLGVCGGYGSKLLERLLPEADLVLAFGAGLNQWTTMFGRLLGDAAIVQCDADARAIGGHRPVRLGLAGDAAEAADALGEELERRGFASDGFRTGEVAAEVRAYSAAEDYADEAGEGLIDPRTLVAELDRLLPPERTVVYDCGHWTWFVTPFLNVPDPAGFVPAQGFMSVGHGLATAIGAAVARPDRPVLALTGDGGAMMALGELDSIIAQGLVVLVAVFNDAAYGAEVHHFGPMGRPTGMVEFGDRDFAAVAVALGARAATVRSADDLAAPIEDWLARPAGPLVLDPRLVSARLAEAFAGGA
ncbi:MAG: hypothetical protein H0V03_08575 [Thermoleophilaceae bacterium]|nr:hypothetical protein [Thermoleophilaceae bacterium]